MAFTVMDTQLSRKKDILAAVRLKKRDSHRHIDMKKMGLFDDSMALTIVV